MTKIQCLNCKDIIESKRRHEWVACSCFSNTEDCTGIYIDGGNDYCRVGGNINNIKFIEETTHDSKKA